MRKAKQKYFYIIGLVIVLYLGYRYYPILNIVTGYASKNMASGLFLANRDFHSMEKDDNGFFPVSLARYSIDTTERSVTASIFGLMKRKSIYIEGRGAVLLNDSTQQYQNFLVPKRVVRKGFLPFPYGDLPQKDTLFKEVNYEKLQKAVHGAFDPAGKKNKQTRSVLVIYKDFIIAEHYAEGFDSQTIINGWSMTKSITSTVYGVMQRKGRLNIMDKSGIKEWEGDQRSKITINDLLHMNSGLAWEEVYFNISDVTKMLYLENEMGQVQIDKPLVAGSDELWNYSSGTTNLLSGDLLRQQFTDHQEYLNFWYRELLDRIGMHSAVVETDVSGNFIGSSYMWANTRDWAKFGLLYLHSGNWNGEQVLDSSWVKYVRTPTHGSEGRYGAHFWLNEGGYFPDVPKEMFYCNGFQGQYICIFPDMNLVVVRTGLASGNHFDVNEFLAEIVSSII
jgi:CubicO group peptidase (beta-lactamase class C family)